MCRLLPLIMCCNTRLIKRGQVQRATLSLLGVKQASKKLDPSKQERTNRSQPREQNNAHTITLRGKSHLHA